VTTDTARLQFNAGVEHHRHGRLDDAIGCYRRAVDADGSFTSAWYNLGVAQQGMGDLPAALAAYGNVVTLKPDHAGALNNRGLVLYRLGRFDEAIKSYLAAIACSASFPDAEMNLINALTATGRLQQAEELCRGLIRAQPKRADLLNNLGSLLAAQARMDEAAECFREALVRDPRLVPAQANLGSVLCVLGREDEALELLDRALARDPGNPDFLVTRGNTRLASLQLDEALRDYDAALQTAADRSSALLGRALVRLVRGDFESAWMDYEARQDGASILAEVQQGRMRYWQGERLADGTLLIAAEQGLGDTLQFVRYLPMVAERVRHVVLEVQPELLGLLKPLNSICQVVARGAARSEARWVCRLLSLPRIFGTVMATIPADVPYLEADPIRSAAWRTRVSATRDTLCIGLVWAGNRGHRNDRKRSIDPACFGALNDCGKVAYLSLQKGTGEFERLAALDAMDLAPDLHDFADTAAALMHIDLLVSVDTAIVHLAGALGRPVWVLLPYSPDWRWLLERTDSPWYPTLRLFRQETPGDWAGVIARVRDAISHVCAVGTTRAI